MILTPLASLTRALINLVYPPQCLLCSATLPDPQRIICPLCYNSLSFNTPPFCYKCSRHINSPGKKICPQCRKRIPDFDKAWPAMIYTEPLKHLLHLFKYKQKTALKYLFADLILTFSKQHALPIETFDYLVPIPIHPTKHREREFNQTQLIAQFLAQQWRKRIIVNNLIRVKHCRPQALLEEKERWTNIQDAFRIRHSLKFKNKSILLIDDLITTGATACEAAKVCKKAGASYVGILTLAAGQ